MGEIIIKVPEDVYEVIDLGLPYKKVKEKLEEIEREERLNKIKRFLSKYGRKLKIEYPKEEELYLQGD